MKTQLSFLLIFLTILACSGLKKVIVEKYPDGKKKVVHVLHTDATNDSIIKQMVYWENGKLNITGFLIGDVPHGIWTQWYENGNKKSEGAWEQGKNIGQWTYWYENGQMQEQGTYKGGQFEELSVNSSKSRPDFIPQKDGEWIYWNKSGYIVKVERWEQGQLKTE